MIGEATSKPIHNTCLTKFVMILSCTGQCDIRNLRLRDYTSRIELYWDCDQTTNEFDFTYQLINAGMCDTGNGTGFPILNLPSSTHSPNSNSRSFYKGSDGDIFMYANSTYLFTVQAKQRQSDGEFIYGRQQGVQLTTSERGKHFFLKMFMNEGGLRNHHV